MTSLMRMQNDPRKGRSGQPVDLRTVIDEHGWSTLIDGARIDNDPTRVDSAAFSLQGWAGAWLAVDINSQLAPTLLRILAQVNIAGVWYDFEEGLWASLCWEDTDTADGIHKIYLLPLGGAYPIRISAIGTGTDATNYFDVSVHIRPFRPVIPVAHA